MLKVSETVAVIVAQSLEASVMLQQGCLNLSAYAKRIQPEVERITKKPVKTGSIVIALSRLGRSLRAERTLLPPPTALEVSARSGLMEVTFERTQRNLELFHALQQRVAPSPNDFFVTTQGTAEITIIAPESRLPQIEAVFTGVAPKFVLTNLSALTVRTTEQDIYTPNTFFAILYHFAMQRLNVIELISTYTEVTLIFEEKDLQEGFEILKRFLRH
ncbi:MAG: hypothetical protein Greene041619_988 [Candidatus Peregrinibacteria bacterium Greene0416_19]|nr:MAG: hypothetical protein Greene041619_988 [Candidatus Peregrinibacteria bacterium Greene0416_19]